MLAVTIMPQQERVNEDRDEASSQRAAKAGGIEDAARDKVKERIT